MDNLTKELIKHEYLSGAGSYETLAKRFGVSADAISRASRKEGWKALKQAARARGAEAENSVRGKSKGIKGRAREERLGKLAEKTLDNVEKLLDGAARLEPKELKALSGTLLDIKALLDIKDIQLTREQELKLKLLQQQLERGERELKDSAEDGVKVLFEGLSEELSG